MYIYLYLRPFHIYCVIQFVRQWLRTAVYSGAGSSASFFPVGPFRSVKRNTKHKICDIAKLQKIFCFVSSDKQWPSASV